MEKVSRKGMWVEVKVAKEKKFGQLSFVFFSLKFPLTKKKTQEGGSGREKTQKQHTHKHTHEKRIIIIIIIIIAKSDDDSVS